MRTRFLLVGMIAASIAMLVAVVGCSDPQAEQRERFDDALHEVEAALGRYYTVDPQGPVSELERVTERVVSTWEAAREEAVGLEGIDFDDAEAAFGTLTRTAEGLDARLTAREGVEILMPHIEAFDEEVEEVHEALDMH